MNQPVTDPLLASYENEKLEHFLHRWMKNREYNNFNLFAQLIIGMCMRYHKGARTASKNLRLGLLHHTPRRRRTSFRKF